MLEPEPVPLRRVLVALDGSDDAQHALGYAIRLGHRFGSEVIVCTALDRARELAATANPDLVYSNAALWLVQCDATAESLLRSAKSRVLAAGLRSTALLLEGPPARAVVECATTQGVDAIVMGTRGNQGLDRAFLGSVAEEVLRFCDVPVFVFNRRTDASSSLAPTPDGTPVRPDGTPVRPDGTPVRPDGTPVRILVALDDSDPADAAMAFAHSLAAAIPTDLLCCTAIETGQLVDNSAIYGCDPAPYVREARQAALALLEKHTAWASTTPARPLECVILEGSPADAILAAARDREADLIVCGTHGRRGLTRMLLGSVAESVVRRSTVPVAVLRTIPLRARHRIAGDVRNGSRSRVGR